MADDNQEKNSEMSDEEKLHRENEIKKLKLSAQYGARFFKGKNDLRPEIENEWLNYIDEFEKQSKNVDQISVAEKLGNPSFPSADGLNETKVEEQLDKLLDLMSENGIYLSVICDEPDEKIYRFIIEELFEHEMDDFQIEGMNTNFIYEEFHPNDKLDLSDTIEHFIWEMLSEDFRNHLDTGLAEKCQSETEETMTKEEAKQKALNFGDAFDSFEDLDITGFQFDINDEADQASVQFEVSYQAISGDDVHQYVGPASASLRRGELGYWNIVSLTMPGFSI